VHSLKDLQKMHTHSTSLLVLYTQWWVGEFSFCGNGIADTVDKAAVIQNSKPTKYTYLFLRYLYNLTKYSYVSVHKVPSSGNQTKVIQHKTKLVPFVHSWCSVRVQMVKMYSCINVTDLDIQYLESSLCTVFRIHHTYTATLQRHVCILTVWLLHQASCIQKWLIWFYAVCINHNQDKLCEPLVKWQLVLTLDVGCQQAMIQECVSVYVHILVSRPVDDPSRVN